MTSANTAEFLASILHSRTKIGAYQGSETDAVTDARALLEALRNRVMNVIDPAMSGKDVKQAVLDFLDPRTTGPSFRQELPEEPAEPSYVPPPIWMI